MEYVIIGVNKKNNIIVSYILCDEFQNTRTILKEELKDDMRRGLRIGNATLTSDNRIVLHQIEQKRTLPTNQGNNKKYELCRDMYTYCGHHKCYHIRALRTFVMSSGKTVHKGDFGGYIEHEGNLAATGLCWIEDGTCVYGNARVSQNAVLLDRATVGDNAVVTGYAIVSGEAKVVGKARIDGHAKVCSRVRDNAVVTDNAIICGIADVGCHAKVSGNAVVQGILVDCVQVHGNAMIGSCAKVSGNTIVTDDAIIEAYADVRTGRVGGNTVMARHSH